MDSSYLVTVPENHKLQKEYSFWLFKRSLSRFPRAARLDAFAEDETAVQLVSEILRTGQAKERWERRPLADKLRGVGIHPLDSAWVAKFKDEYKANFCEERAREFAGGGFAEPPPAWWTVVVWSFLFLMLGVAFGKLMPPEFTQIPEIPFGVVVLAATAFGSLVGLYRAWRKPVIARTRRQLHFESAKTFLTSATRWDVMSFDNWVALNSSKPFAHPIPHDVREKAKAIEQALPGAKLEVEFFYEDPFLRVRYGNETCYISHW